MNKEMIIEKAKEVWVDIKANQDVFWIGASLGVIIGAII